MNIKILWSTFTIGFLHNCSGWSLSAFLSDLKDSLMYYSVSQVYEQCDERWVTQNIQDLENDLHEFVFGQELACNAVLDALRAHSSKTYRRKPLVLNFHGWPGGGKGYVAEFIVKNWFKKGEQSKFVKKYFAKIDFPSNSEVYRYQAQLRSEIEATIRKCPKAMFVFDEADKYPPHLLDYIKPYLDYNTNIKGYDFREAIFIFITNIGETLITQIALDNRKSGKSRESLTLHDFDHLLKTTAFNDERGFYKSDLIKHNLIDVVVPFLPLESQHVELCVRSELKLQYINPNIAQSALREIMSKITYGPPGDEVFSINGCKGISDKVGVIAEKERRRGKMPRKTEF